MLACKNMSLDTSEHLLLVYVDKDKTLAQLHQHVRLNGTFAHLRKVPKSHMVVQIFNLACINYIREVSIFFMTTKFTLVLL